MRYFVRHPGQSVVRARITARQIYDFETERDSNVLEVYINRLRPRKFRT
ncbi:MAG: winged helix-turn-helix domain-containing protein [Gammaproteobacteria bacterium]|nr:winged helix-turn-helix domain-containing protein [Gammaproteobacteria bacterium]